MRVGVIVVGVLVLLVGLVWTGQGLGYIKGSFMTGDMKWFWIGLVLVVLGLVMGVGGWRSGRRQSRV
jgi:heme A synthase